MPVVFMTVDPVIVEAPPSVLPVRVAPARVLLVRVSVASRVTIVPALGNTAVELMPVPPLLVGKVPVTAAVCDRLMAANVGMPPPAGTVKLW